MVSDAIPELVGNPGARAREGAKDLWTGVDALLETAVSDEALVGHRLHLLDANRRRAAALPVPSGLRHAERLAALRALGLPLLLARARAAYGGQLVLMKGADVAEHYPDPLTRPFVDIDLLADDVGAAQAALRRAGFREVGEPLKYQDIHHLRPLVWPGLPLRIEIHSAPKWLPDLPSAPTDELLAAAVPGLDGVGRLPCEHHAVLLAVHAWAHAPLGRAGDLVDVAAMTAAGDRDTAVALAHRWGCGRLYDVTLRAADALLGDARRPLALHLWARHLRRARDRTVFEAHLSSHLDVAWRVPRRSAPCALVRSALIDLRPSEGESWRRKSARARRAILSARDAKSSYDRRLGPSDPLATTTPFNRGAGGRPG